MLTAHDGVVFRFTVRKRMKLRLPNVPLIWRRSAGRRKLQRRKLPGLPRRRKRRRNVRRKKPSV